MQWWQEFPRGIVSRGSVHSNCPHYKQQPTPTVSINDGLKGRERERENEMERRILSTLFEFVEILINDGYF